MPEIGEVVGNYDQQIDKMIGKLDPKTVWRDQAGVTATYDRDTAVNMATERLVPLDYSLDVAWRTRMQQVKDAWIEHAGSRPYQETMALVDQLENTDLSRSLRDWLLVADPFEQSVDRNKVADKGAALLDRLARCYEIAGASRAAEFLPDLVAMTRWVRKRMRAIELGQHSAEKAASVPHKMYLELQSAISKSIDDTREEVRRVAVSTNDTDGPDACVSDWETARDLRTYQLTRGGTGEDLFDFWDDGVDEAFRYSSVYKIPETELRNLFKSRDFKGQIEKMYREIGSGDRRTEDYALRVRDAAWAAQTTINDYLRGIARIWPAEGGARSSRDDLTGNLCALADRLRKEVNFIITSQLARQ